MHFCQTKIQGVFEIRLDLHEDERGFFSRAWCSKEYAENGLNPRLVQCSLSSNRQKGTLRGMHYQAVPHSEAKSVRVIRGAIYDVVLDLRPQSTTFRQWIGVTLTAANRDMVYIPEGCAHGFLTLEDDSEIFYQISEYYHPESARGVRWNDPAFGIDWPAQPEIISERDRTFADFK